MRRNSGSPIGRSSIRTAPVRRSRFSWAEASRRRNRSRRLPPTTRTSSLRSDGSGARPSSPFSSRPARTRGPSSTDSPRRASCPSTAPSGARGPSGPSRRRCSSRSSRRNRPALLAAFDAGYYEFPRNVTTEDVSLSLGIARSTFEQHLNRAEHHVIRAMVPMVRMRSGRPPAEALEVYSKFSRELGLYVQLEVLGDRVAGVRLARSAPKDNAGSDHPYLARILEHVRTGKDDLTDIPLHLEVGPFEREVLDFLRTIPAGQTVTYGEIARRLGRPGASRAVGTACARNPAVIVIPCHRVVPKSGGLGNYSSEGGPETKRKLLEREGARIPDVSVAASEMENPRNPAKRSARPRST